MTEQTHVPRYPCSEAQCGHGHVRGIETNFPTLSSWAGGHLAFAQVSMVTLVIVANIHLEKSTL